MTSRVLVIALPIEAKIKHLVHFTKRATIDKKPVSSKPKAKVSIANLATIPHFSTTEKAKSKAHAESPTPQVSSLKIHEPSPGTQSLRLQGHFHLPIHSPTAKLLSSLNIPFDFPGPSPNFPNNISYFSGRDPNPQTLSMTLLNKMTRLESIILLYQATIQAYHHQLSILQDQSTNSPSCTPEAEEEDEGSEGEFEY
jgi:hypothetical protein